jgi:hypothetical protein
MKSDFSERNYMTTYVIILLAIRIGGFFYYCGAREGEKAVEILISLAILMPVFGRILGWC